MKFTLPKSNRHRIIGALAIVLPLCLFVAAKSAASWYPLKIGDVEQGDGSYIEQVPVIAATKDQVVIAFNHECAWFDLHTRQKRAANYYFRGATSDGRGLWWVKGKVPCQLVIEQDGRTHTFDIPDPAASWMQRRSRLPMSVNVSSDRVEALIGLLYLRWSPESLKLQKQINLARTSEIPEAYGCDKYGYRDFGDCGNYSLKGQGKVVALFENEFLAISTQSGRIVKRISVEKPRSGARPSAEPLALRRFSSRGTYAVLANTDANQYHVVATKSGRTLWTAARLTFGDIALSADERSIVLRKNDRWEVRDLATGELLNTAPMLFYSDFTGISPDANTLYTIDRNNGSLYRQRIR